MLVKSYQELLDWLYVQIPNYQQQGQKAYKPNLQRVQDFVHYLGNPHRVAPVVHIAGTNGKGSTAHILASVLQASGFKVGLYTSPHLVDFRERIKIDGRCVAKAWVVDFIQKHIDFIEEIQASFFEITVAMAFDYFGSQDVDISVVEVGLGGRLDATNIVYPSLSVITNIGWDHTEFLGETLSEIATEKAGIIKACVPVVIGQYQKAIFPIFEKKACQMASRLHKAWVLNSAGYTTDLKGFYQQHNLKTVLKSVEVLRSLGWHISKNQLKQGLNNVVTNTGLQGRWQCMGQQPLIICDTAHNVAGFTETISQLKTYEANHLHLVLGFVKGKNLDAIFSLLPKKATYYFCKPTLERGLSLDVLAQKATACHLESAVYKSVQQAFEQACKRADKADVIYVGGSTFVVAEVLNDVGGGWQN